MHSYFVYLLTSKESGTRESSPVLLSMAVKNFCSNKITTNIVLLHSKSYIDVIKES